VCVWGCGWVKGEGGAEWGGQRGRNGGCALRWWGWGGGVVCGAGVRTPVRRGTPAQQTHIMRGIERGEYASPVVAAVSVARNGEYASFVKPPSSDARRGVGR